MCVTGNFKPIGIPLILNLLVRAVKNVTGNFPHKSFIQSELTIAIFLFFYLFIYYFFLRERELR